MNPLFFLIFISTTNFLTFTLPILSPVPLQGGVSEQVAACLRELNHITTLNIPFM